MNKITALLAVLFLSACATTDTREVQCFKAIAIANQSLTVAYKSVETLITEGQINFDVAENALIQLDNASSTVDSAIPVCAYADSEAVIIVEQAAQILSQTQNYIKENKND